MRFKKPGAIINARSGSTSDITEDLKAKLSAHADGLGPILFAEPDEMEAGIASIFDADCDLIIVYGGDGTICSIAQTASEKNIPTVALPGGTMNMLPKALYDGTENWQTALDMALSCEAPRWVPAGVIEDHIFLCACLLGTPTHLNEVREQLRDLNIVEAMEEFVFRAMDFDTSDVLSYRVGGSDGDLKIANLMNVACPLMRDDMNDGDGFEIAGITVDKVSDIAALGLTAVVSDWRESRTAETAIGELVHIESEAPVDALLDGEPKQFTKPFQISLREKGALFLAP